MVKRGFQWFLFGAFFVAACAAVTTWATTESLEQAGFWATFAAFFATASAFIDRLFPDERTDNDRARDTGDE